MKGGCSVCYSKRFFVFFDSNAKESEAEYEVGMCDT